METVELLTSALFAVLTLKSLIEEHVRLDFSDFFFHPAHNFYVANKKFHPAGLFIYLVNKQAGQHFFSNLPHLFQSARLIGTSRYFRHKAYFSVAILWFLIFYILCFSKCNMYIHYCWKHYVETLRRNIT